MPVGRVLVVGAGPKALAIAAKAEALRATGHEVADVVLVDRTGVAANWSGADGYTDGNQRLGTPPEKDVGHPYAASWGAASADVCAAVQAHSWQRYLIGQGAWAEWVDRGRSRPVHRRWADYLEWVARGLGQAPVAMDVTGLDVVGERWTVTGRDPRSGDDLAIEADGVVITGPGPPLPPPGHPAPSPLILDGRSFWQHADGLRRRGPLEVCVVGSGETAGSVAAALLDLLPTSIIEIVTSDGMLYSRGESYAENRYYSSPDEGWTRLAERHRREFLRRTDRGAFSLQVQQVLDRAERVRTVAGRVTDLIPGPDKVTVEIRYERDREHVAFDLVVVATGFDPLWFVDLLGDEARLRVAAMLPDAPAGEGEGGTLSLDRFERAVSTDLSLGGLAPALHLPALAGMAQGPGFPNLSCLGLLADRVLRPYVSLRPAAPAQPTLETVAAGALRR